MAEVRTFSLIHVFQTDFAAVLSVATRRSANSQNLGCLTRDPKPLPKPDLHTVRSSVSSFNFQYPLVFLRSFNSCLLLLPHLPVTSFPYLSFNNVFYGVVSTSDVTNPVSIPYLSVIWRISFFLVSV
jgi:hypothetical protein